MPARPWRGVLVPGGLAAALLLVLSLAGCSTTEVVRSGGSGSSGPLADSPTGVVARLLWAYDHRDADVHAGLFTGDYQFVFASSDSVGAPFRAIPWGLTYEVVSAHHLFVGGGTEPAATSIRTSIAGSVQYPGPGKLHDFPDPRPGKDPSAHRVVVAEIALTIGREIGDLVARGNESFFVVRGDSARVTGGNANQWYVERWEEQSADIGLLAKASGTGSVAATPSWGAIKVLYLGPVRD